LPFRNYCFTGGALKLIGVRPRDGSASGLLLTAILRTLRTPAQVDVEVLGGLPLEHEEHSTANYDCHSGCHADAFVSYQLPAATEKAAMESGLQLRISGGGCKVEMTFAPEIVRQVLKPK
jgi:hypothetical protein